MNNNSKILGLKLSTFNWLLKRVGKTRTTWQLVHRQLLSLKVNIKMFVAKYIAIVCIALLAHDATAAPSSASAKRKARNTAAGAMITACGPDISAAVAPYKPYNDVLVQAVNQSHGKLPKAPVVPAATPSTLPTQDKCKSLVADAVKD